MADSDPKAVSLMRLEVALERIARAHLTQQDPGAVPDPRALLLASRLDGVIAQLRVALGKDGSL